MFLQLRVHTIASILPNYLPNYYVAEDIKHLNTCNIVSRKCYLIIELSIIIELLRLPKYILKTIIIKWFY